jgi:hypothetical protein
MYLNKMHYQHRVALNFILPFFMCAIAGRRQLLRSLNVGLYRLGEYFQFDIKSFNTVFMERQPERATLSSFSSGLKLRI